MLLTVSILGHTVPPNPSIGEGSVGAMTMGSLNLSHGSNLDKIGRGDHDGASTMAMAGKLKLISLRGDVTSVLFKMLPFCGKA